MSYSTDLRYRQGYCGFIANNANVFTIVNSYGGDKVSYHYSKTLARKKYRQGTRMLEALSNTTTLFTYLSLYENISLCIIP